MSAVDRRNEADPTWIGAIRGGYGNPLKELHLSEPLKETVATAFRDALKARGLLSSNGQAPLDLSITIPKFESTQVARRESEATIAIDVLDRSTSRLVYHDQANVDLVTGSILTLDAGMFASPSDLQVVAQNSLIQVIDRVLDKPSFVATPRGT